MVLRQAQDERVSDPLVAGCGQQPAGCVWFDKLTMSGIIKRATGIRERLILTFYPTWMLQMFLKKNFEDFYMDPETSSG
jgi:hypothetical protein